MCKRTVLELNFQTKLICTRVNQNAGPRISPQTSQVHGLNIDINKTKLENLSLLEFLIVSSRVMEISDEGGNFLIKVKQSKKRKL